MNWFWIGIILVFVAMVVANLMLLKQSKGFKTPKDFEKNKQKKPAKGFEDEEDW